MQRLIRENKKLIRFLLLCFMGYTGWFILYDQWIGPDQRTDFTLSNIEAGHTACILQLLGYEITPVIEGVKHVFYYQGQRTIGLASNCNGLVLFPLFGFFIVASQGTWKRKIIYIFTGCLLIYVLNLIRISGLVLIKIYHPESLDFNHKYTFTIVVYGFIFYLWYLWINKFSTVKKSND